jgi:hypothetical protein
MSEQPGQLDVTDVLPENWSGFWVPLHSMRYAYLFLTCWFAFQAFAASLTVAKPEEVGFSAERLKRVRSVVQTHIDAKDFNGAVTLIWNFLYQNPNVTRGEAIKALTARGMNKGTISTQYQKWRHASDDDRRTRAGIYGIGG